MSLLGFYHFSFLVFTYFLGAIPFAVLVSKPKGIDLTKVGSGNFGATNVYRAMGLKAALLVFSLDAFKGFLPVYLSMQIWPEAYFFHVWVGVLAVFAHSLSVFLRFKGGKGAATGLGMLLALSPKVFLVLFGLAAAIIYTTRYVALATIVASFLAPILFYVWGYPTAYFSVVLALAFFILLRHKANVQRLIKGEENKV